MAHRGRLVTALSHEQPDRVPIDFDGTLNSSVVVEGYEKPLQYFGVEAESQIVQSITAYTKCRYTEILLDAQTCPLHYHAVGSSF